MNRSKTNHPSFIFVGTFGGWYIIHSAARIGSFATRDR